ncbi:unnamed protein product [Chrysoparadoxa australica]
MSATAEKDDSMAWAGASGALFGAVGAHLLHLDLDLYGAAVGGLVGLYLSDKEGAVGKATRTVGGFTKTSVDIASSLYKESNIGSKITGGISEEVVDFVQITAEVLNEASRDKLVAEAEAKAAAAEERAKKVAAAAEERVEKVAAAATGDQRKFEDLSSKVNGLEEAVKTATEEARQLRMEVTSLQSKLSSAEEKNKDLKMKLDEAAKVKKSLQDQLTETLEGTAASAGDMEANFIKLSQVSTELKDRVEEYELKLNDIQSSSASEVSELQEQVLALQADKSGLAADLAAAQKEVSALQAQQAEASLAVEAAPAVAAFSEPEPVIAEPEPEPELEQAPMMADSDLLLEWEEEAKEEIVVVAEEEPESEFTFQAIEEPQEAVPMGGLDALQKLTVKELRAQLKKVGLPTTGRKADLVARLVEVCRSWFWLWRVPPTRLIDYCNPSLCRHERILRESWCTELMRSMEG